ncbi:MAG: DUF6883 domain-containing protein [Tepidisphaeraceae bacterium]|jgi:hypothetical protein
MKIPPDAIIAPEKLTKYLLVPLPKSDKSRFLAKIGFNPHNWRELERAIRTVAASADALPGSFSPHGAKWLVDGIIEGPTGLTGRVRTIWLEESGGLFRFVTLLPRTGA